MAQGPGRGLLILREHASAALGAWLDALFPPRCLGCGRRGLHFCQVCVAAVRPVPPPWCASCGCTLPPLAGRYCADCRSAPLPLAAVRSAGRLEGPLRRAIHGLKYRGRRDAAESLAELLLVPLARLDPPLATGAPHPPLVVPIPLAPDREAIRGYNQAALLAGPLAARARLPYQSSPLRRVRPTLPQVGLSRRQRRANVRGAFAAAAVEGRSVVLVDDVTTTGSTLGSAASACLAAGAARVYAVTLAREW